MHGVWSYVMFTLTFNFKYPSWCSLTLQASLDPNYQYDRCVYKSSHYHTRFCPKIVASEGTCMLMSFEICNMYRGGWTRVTRGICQVSTFTLV